MNMLSTRIVTGDNRLMTVPNNQVRVRSAYPSREIREGLSLAAP